LHAPAPHGTISADGQWACSSAVEQWTFNPLVVGSNPTGLTMFFMVYQRNDE
jgi:hypothetical protein